MISTYRSKKTFEAVQWNGENKEEMKDFCGEHLIFDYFSNKAPALSIDDKKVNLFDFVCKIDNDFKIFNQEYFNSNYERSN